MLVKKKKLVEVGIVSILVLGFMLFSMINVDSDAIRNCVTNYNIVGTYLTTSENVKQQVQQVQAIVQQQESVSVTSLGASSSGNLSDFLKIADDVVHTFIRQHVPYSIGGGDYRGHAVVCCASYVSEVLLKAGYIDGSDYSANAGCVARTLMDMGYEVNYDPDKIADGDVVYMLYNSSAPSYKQTCINFITRQSSRTVNSHIQIACNVADNTYYSVGQGDYVQGQPRKGHRVAERFICSFRVLKGVSDK